jgi:type VI secretion system FHA domain protein
MQLMAGAGIGAEQVTGEMAHQIGRILRAVISGVIDLLRARAHIKDEFRMGHATRWNSAKKNNPLKLSADVQDALQNLFLKRNPAYLGPFDAFEDAFEDLRNHQVATLACRL